MKCTIVFTREAIEDLKAFKARQQKILLHTIDTFEIRAEKSKTRVFFDVESDLVTIIAIMPKERRQAWLQKYGKTTKEG